MKKGIPSIYELKELTDSLISRTRLVLNEFTFAVQEGSPILNGLQTKSSAWVCFLKPEDSYESELVSHMPKPGPLVISLKDVLYVPPPSGVPGWLLAPFDFPTGFVEQEQAILDQKRSQLYSEYLIGLSELKAQDLVPPEILKEEFPERGNPALSPTGADPADPLAAARGPFPVAERVVPQHPLSLEDFNWYVEASGRNFVAPQRFAGIRAVPGQQLIIATGDDKRPVPRFRGTTPVEVSEMFIQILFAVRCMMLVLIDASGSLCHDGQGDPDPDYVGNLPASCVLSVMSKMSQWDIDDFVPNCKYWKDFPLASCLSNPLPGIPESWSRHNLAADEPLFSGALRKFWRRICHPLPEGEVGSLLYRAAFSIAQSKKGFHPVPNSFITEAYEKHRKTMVAKPERFDETELDQFLKVFFRHYEPKDLFSQLAVKEGSNRASNLYPCCLGGARQDVIVQLQEILPKNWLPENKSLVRMVESKDGIIEERGWLPPSLNEWVDIVSRPIERRLEQSRVDPSDVPLEHRDLPWARVVGITEPLKVRVITAMPALSTFIAKPVQKSLWDYLRKFPCFDLISKPVSEDIVRDLITRHRKMFGDEAEWDIVSGDYKAATDKLYMQATQAVEKALISKLRGRDTLLIPHVQEVLKPCILEYPQRQRGKYMFVVQSNGQLMGSVLSFPILCILNLFTYFMSLEPSVRRRILRGLISLKALPVLVNGDDILFRANAEMFARWMKAGSSLGFELSLGKNFVHARFCTVNSCPIEIRTSIRQVGILKPGESWADAENEPAKSFWIDSVTLLGFPNIGLLIGLSKTAKGVRDDALPLNAWYAGAVMGSLYPKKMSNFFINYHKVDIAMQTSFGSRTLNVFAHPYLGGLGFPIPEGLTPRYSEAQRALAAHLLAGAMKVIHCIPSEHPLSPLLFLEPSLRTRASLGVKPGYVQTFLGPLIGPLPEQQKPFVDNSVIHLTPLSHEPAQEVLLGKLTLRPRCRLSNRELSALLKRANHQRMPLVDVAEMHIFPYRVLQGALPEIDLSLDTQVMTSEHLDLPTEDQSAILPEDEETTSTIPVGTQQDSPEPLELWEYPTLPFLSQIKGSLKLRSLQHVLELEEKARKSLAIKRRKEVRRHHNLQLY